MAIEAAFCVGAAHAAIKAQVDRINALNVYPVPDGDTGTNMLLTLESVLNETAGKTYESPEAASRAGARAALMGARGNSGVILSQMIRGACEVLAGREGFTPETYTEALEGARDRAYASVREPVEGTMLTVVKDAARGARAALEGGADLAGVVGVAAAAAHESVRRTPELLDVLREAGVVDAGGLGVAVILDGIRACVTGEEIEAPSEEEGGTPDLEAIHAGEEAWGYCTNFLVTGFAGDHAEFEERIRARGRSVLVVADDDLVKVHLHTQDPGDAISYAGTFGRLAAVKVDDMEAQVEGQIEAGPRVSRSQETSRPPASLAVVAASRGAGNSGLFESMGAVVVEGGQGANPSAADFARSVEETGAPSVILLPNNTNIVPTAEQVGELVDAEVHVVPTTTIAAGLAAMVGFDAEGEPGEVVEEMQEISAALQSAEVTRAVRDARIGDISVPEGAFMGLLDGDLVAVEKSVEGVALALARRIVADGADYITLLCGEGLDEADAHGLANRIRELDDRLVVEVRDGGQPLYPLQMAAE
ncbi:MAG TPA: DAK2 domain-containing protein [Rubrobacteraceae bacterium]|nr:DAK2 domain-containing protein [Rubrobacteraceae bacterium]